MIFSSVEPVFYFFLVGFPWKLNLIMYSCFHLQYVPILMVLFGIHGCMFIFAICCFAGAAFVLIYLPETKGKRLETILAAIEERTSR